MFQLQGRTLLLRSLSIKDNRSLFDLYMAMSDRDIRLYGRLQEKDFDEIISDSALMTLEEEGERIFAVCDKENKNFLGELYLQKKGEDFIFDFGMMSDRKEQQYSAELIDLIMQSLDYLFPHSNIYCYVDKICLTKRKVLERIGFQLDEKMPISPFLSYSLFGAIR